MNWVDKVQIVLHSDFDRNRGSVSTEAGGIENHSNPSQFISQIDETYS